MRFCIKEENDEIPSVPPGFESFASFTLKSAQDGEKQETQDIITCSASVSSSDLQPTRTEMDTNSCADTKVTRSLRRRACINYGQLDNNSSEDESDSAKLNQVSIFY